MRWPWWVRCRSSLYVPGNLGIPVKLRCRYHRGHDGPHAQHHGFGAKVWDDTASKHVSKHAN